MDSLVISWEMSGRKTEVIRRCEILMEYRKFAFFSSSSGSPCPNTLLLIRTSFRGMWIVRLPEEHWSPVLSSPNDPWLRMSMGTAEETRILSFLGDHVTRRLFIADVRRHWNGSFYWKSIGTGFINRRISIFDQLRRELEGAFYWGNKLHISMLFLGTASLLGPESGNRFIRYPWRWEMSRSQHTFTSRLVGIETGMVWRRLIYRMERNKLFRFSFARFVSGQ